MESICQIVNTDSTRRSYQNVSLQLHAFLGINACNPISVQTKNLSLWVITKMTN